MRSICRQQTSVYLFVVILASEKKLISKRKLRMRKKAKDMT